MPSSGITNSIGIESAALSDWIVGTIGGGGTAITVADGNKLICKCRAKVITNNSTDTEFFIGAALAGQSGVTPVSNYGKINEDLILQSNLLMNSGEKLTVLGKTGKTNLIANISIIILRQGKQ